MNRHFCFFACMAAQLAFAGAAHAQVTGRWHVTVITGVRVIAPSASLATGEQAYLDIRADSTYRLWRPERGLSGQVDRLLGTGRWRTERSASVHEVGLCLQPTGTGAICGLAVLAEPTPIMRSLSWMVGGAVALTGCSADGKLAEDLLPDLPTPCYSPSEQARRRRAEQPRCDSLRSVPDSLLTFDYDVSLLSGSPPAFPAGTRDSGWVRVTFVIQGDGSVDRSSIKIDSSSNRVFEAPVLKVLQTYRFDEPTIGTCRLRRTVHMPFLFRP